MKTIPSGLLTSLENDITTRLTTCVKVIRTDGEVFGFTMHDKDLEISGVDYLSVHGYTMTAIRGSSDLSVGSLEISGAFDSLGVTEDDIRAGKWDYARLEFFRVDWSDVTKGIEKLKCGKLGQLVSGRNGYSAEIRDLMQHLQQDIGELYGPADPVDLGDARNGLNIATYTFSGTITSIVDDSISFAASAMAQANGYFDGGKMTFTSGLNDGLAMEVKTYSLSLGGRFTLQIPMPFQVQVGDTFEVTAGYDKSIETALSKFNNVINFRGWKWVPGTDKMLSGGI